MGANLKEVRTRIKSVISTQQITKAMKMVSAAKLRRAQESITQLRPYADKLDEMLSNIAAGNTDSDAIAPLTVLRQHDRVLFMVITSSRGLCGAFNTNIIKQAVKRIDDHYAEQRDRGDITIACIGKRGYDFFKKRYPNCNVVDDYVDLFSDLSFDNISTLANLMIKRYVTARYDIIDVAYSRFKNAGVQYPEVQQFLPIVPPGENESREDKPSTNADYIFEPSEDELLKHLVPSILQVQFQKYLLDTHASEHGARMTAMDKATENANELLRDLKITYNKARQEAITKELSEIVGGAAALSG